MVNRVILLMIFFFSGTVFSETEFPVEVNAAVDLYKAKENAPLQGTLTVTHTPLQIIDKESVKLESQLLKLELIKIVPLPSGNAQLSLFRFFIPGKPKGLYVLPEISLKVGDRVVNSLPTTYEVVEANDIKIHKPVVAENEIPTLFLKVGLLTDPPIYPGQNFTIAYQISYSGNIELQEEELPLLEGKGFRKIGGSIITESHEGKLSVQQIAQEFQAISAGDFSFPVSKVAGYTYKNSSGERIYLEPKVYSEASPVVIKISPFPTQDQPKTFEGSVGSFTFNTYLFSNAPITADSKLQLALEIEGEGVSNVKLPSSITNVLKPLFRMSDLPTIEYEKNKKRFILELYPLSSQVAEIPALTFSFFDPKKKRYETLKSNPISIKITSFSDAEKKSEINKVYDLAPLEIISIKTLAPRDVGSLPLGSWKSLWIVPAIFGALFLQVALRKFLKEKKKNRVLTSQILWKQALSSPINTADFRRYLSEALILKLFEKECINQIKKNPEELPKIGISGKVRGFLLSLEEKTFSGKNKTLDSKDLDNAKKIFDLIGSSDEKDI